MNALKISGTCVLIFSFVWWMIRNEFFDLMCPQECPAFKKGVCFEGNSKYFATGKYKAGDSTEILFRKIEYLNTYSNRIVTWRRCFIVASLVSILLFSLIEIPRTTTNIFIVFTVVFICVNGMLSFYKFHLDVYPQGYIQENINALREKTNHPRVPILSDDILETIAYITGKSPQ